MSTNLVAVAAITKCSVTGKRIFETEKAAQEFVDDHRATNGAQFPYLCPECEKWHLSSSRPGDNGVTTDYSRIEHFTPSKNKYQRHRVPTTEEVQQAIKLNQQGTSIRKIAERFNLNCQKLYWTMRKSKEGSPSIEFQQVQTVSSLETQERELTAKLEQLRTRKQQLIEENKIKMINENGTVTIKKGTKTLAGLTEEDCLELGVLLEQVLGAVAEVNKP